MDVVIMTLTAFIPFSCIPEAMRFPFAKNDPLLSGVMISGLVGKMIGVSPYDEYQFFNSYVSNTAEENDDEDNWEFIVTTNPAYDIAVDQYFKMRFPPFMYWCFIRGDSLATGGSAESHV